MHRLTVRSIAASITLMAALPVPRSLVAQSAKTAPTPPPTPTPKEQPPAAAPAKNFPVPPHRSFALPNGMMVTLIPFGSIPKVTMDLRTRTGVIDEGPNDVSLASVVGDMMLEGTTTRSALDIARQGAEMGGTITSTWGSEFMTLTGEVLIDHAAAFIPLFADVALHPNFADGDVKRVIDQHARDNAMALTQADNLAMKAFREVMYGNHPFGRIYPSEAMLRGFTSIRIKDFYQKNFSATRAHLYVSGVFDAAAVERAVRAAFGGWQTGAPPTVNPPAIATAHQVTVVDRPKSVQSAILIGVAAPSPSDSDWIRMGVTDALLGGAFGSRITANIREDKGYTYSPYSQLMVRKGATLWMEGADVTSNVTAASLTEIVKEVNRLRTEAPPTAELDGIKNNVAGLFVIGNSSRAGLIGQFGFLDLHGLGDDYLASYVKNVMAVNPEQVRATAERYLLPGKMSIAIVGDKKSVEAQLGKVKPIVP